MKIFCLIPAYNETGNLSDLSARLTSVLNKIKLQYKIVYLIQEDKKGLEILEKLHKKNRKIIYEYYPRALGIGQAYRTGFGKINNHWSHILTLDADLNHQPEELPKFLEAYRKTKADIIIGSRFISGGQSHDRRYWKIFISKFINVLVNNILGIAILDKTSGFRLIKFEAINMIRNQLKENGYPSYLEFILLAQKSGCKIVEVPITYIPRSWGKSKMEKKQTAWEYMLFLTKLIFSSHKSKPAERYQ